jgi:hypothetical protein
VGKQMAEDIAMTIQRSRKVHSAAVPTLFVGAFMACAQIFACASENGTREVVPEASVVSQSAATSGLPPQPSATTWAALASASSANPSLGPLSAGEIQGVVAANHTGIRKRCWQPALDSASADTPGSARVKAHFVIGPSGAVESASASGAEKDFPALSSCIANQIKAWKFPPSSGSTPVDVGAYPLRTPIDASLSSFQADAGHMCVGDDAIFAF